MEQFQTQNYEDYSKIIRRSWIIIILFCLQSCHTLTCEESVKYNSEFELKLIVKDISHNGNLIDIDGISLDTHKSSNFHHNSDWYFSIGDKIFIGDTLIKKKGEPIIKLYRKGERWSFTYTCKKDEQGNDIVRSEDIKF